MTFIWYPKCSTCKKAANWLKEQKIQVVTRDIKEENPTVEELREWHLKSSLPLNKFFNTTGLLYNSMNLKEKLPQMTEEEQLAVLATDGMLVKRPILITDRTVLVGFRPAEWEEVLKP